MKIIAISDTHGQHKDLQLPEGDILLHAGDVSKRGSRAEIMDFLFWFSEQPHKYRIFIAGNHDFYFEKTGKEQINSDMPKNVVYLNDSGTEIEGIKIWGSPIQPWFYDWAFNRQRGPDIKKHWDLIPNDTDILLTHGPAYGILDLTMDGRAVGCEDLLKKIQDIKPKYHICGHIHEAYGQERAGETNFINASVLNLDYKLVNKAFVFEI